MVSVWYLVTAILQTEDSEIGTADKSEKTTSNVDKITPKDVKFIASTITDVADDDGWAFLGDVGSLLQKKQPNFDSRNFGFAKLTPLFKSIKEFEVETRDSGKGRFKLIYVRIKETPKQNRTRNPNSKPMA